MRFEELHLIEPLLRAVHSEGYTQPSPIQQQAIPNILQGRDVLGCAQTGTGKTAAFALPILQHLTKKPRTDKFPPIRVLVLAPTRELAAQIGESFETYGKYTDIQQATIFGGVNQNNQIKRLRQGVDVLVATPGRLIDLMGQGIIRLNRVEILVLDEADRMLDMGFINDMRRIIAALPTSRQTLLFSATMPKDILEFAQNILRDPVHIEVTPVASTVDTIQQRIYFVEHDSKFALLEHLLRDKAVIRALVFTRTKHRADKVARQLNHAHIHAEAIHGNKSQSARERALSNFENGTTRILVATDIAARGLDIDQVSHVINFDLPNEPESYVHRIGRTGRAGADGIAYSLCDVEERAYLKSIERLIQLHIPPVTDHPYLSNLGLPQPTELNPSKRHQQQQGGVLQPFKNNTSRRRPRPQHRSNKVGNRA